MASSKPGQPVDRTRKRLRVLIGILLGILLAGILCLAGLGVWLWNSGNIQVIHSIR